MEKVNRINLKLQLKTPALIGTETEKKLNGITHSGKE